ncbi:hypothetical protein CDEST_14258 [Colletotrichum destructivum]|uniref:Uncharacterized protein n=1 Tax=Colletotrichum destructivum TaxID=34406 RepID=A0AAX4J124_9PEZI|nr:hypothetical protein CDEST_14258 [Colletotrichum destructivum]
MDMVAIGERRAGKRPKARAYAMVSAGGVADWSNPQGSNDKPDSQIILSQHSVVFFRKLRAKVGNADFFGSRTLNKDVANYIRDLPLSL